MHSTNCLHLNVCAENLSVVSKAMGKKRWTEVQRFLYLINPALFNKGSTEGSCPRKRL